VSVSSEGSWARFHCKSNRPDSSWVQSTVMGSSCLLHLRLSR
jgi:hypothetical protein